MNKAEKLLRLCADTMKMPGWNDALSLMTEKNAACALPDELLENVAGGITKDVQFCIADSGANGHKGADIT